MNLNLAEKYVSIYTLKVNFGLYVSDQTEIYKIFYFISYLLLMKNRHLLLFLLLWLIPFFGSAQNASKVEPYKLVYKLKPAAAAMAKGMAKNPVQQVLQKIAAKPAQQKFPRSGPDTHARSLHPNAVDISLIYELEYLPGQSFAQIKKQLLATGQIEYVEPLYRYEPLLAPNDPLADSTTGGQEYLKIIKAYAAWNISQGDTNVVIGILDTGVRLTHEDLKDNLKYNYADPLDGLDNDGDGYPDNYHGWDLADDDNDPTANANGHGTSVTGVAAATPNNGKGMVGIGFNCKFLPIKVFASTDQGAFRGYEGIVYAAEHGCQIINLSWGGVGFPSAFEQDIINYATINRNVVIVAAAGNTNLDLDFYPASYSNVLSVGSVTRNDIKSPNHTFSYAIKIAAQGSDVQITGNSNNSHYSRGNGSSYAAPMVSGAAALVRSHFPELTAPQVVERLRVTADDIYGLEGNSTYTEQLGRGRLNVYRALAETAPKSVRLQTWQLANESSSTKPGETISLYGTYKNFLSPVTELTITVTSSNEYLEVVQGQFSAGSMATLAEKDNQAAPFSFRVAENTPSNSLAIVRFGFTDGTYTDYQYIKFNLNPDFVTTDVNQISMSVISRGNVAYDGQNMLVGHGIRYRDSSPLLAEGGLLVGYSPTLVSDNIRNERGQTDLDFYAVSTLERHQSSPVAEFVASNILEDSLTESKTLSVRINQRVLAWADAPNQDFVILEYLLTNRSAQTLDQTYAGMFADWDLLDAGRNVTEWNNALKLGIIRHVSDTFIWVGIQVLSAGAPGFYALENSASREESINIGDGFTTAEKYAALSGGVQREEAGDPQNGSDVSYVISTKVKALAPSEQDNVTFAFVAGLTRAELYQNATAAAAKYQMLIAQEILPSAPEDFAHAITLYPNPSQGQVSVSFPDSLQQATIFLQIIDAQGRLVQEIEHKGAVKVDLKVTHLPAGFYSVRITTSGHTIVKKLLVLR